MEEILDHPTCMKPYKEWDIYRINWLPDFWTINIPLASMGLVFLPTDLP